MATGAALRSSEILPADQFDELYVPPVPIGREVETSRGPIDNLSVSPDGGITIPETKLWKNPEKRKVQQPTVGSSICWRSHARPQIEARILWLSVSQWPHAGHVASDG